MSPPPPPYERFVAWQHCHRLVLATYRVTATFPTGERYGLTSQARRAAFSAAANIAEGAAKRGSAEFRRFVDISLGSLAELSYIIQLTAELGLLAGPDREVLQAVHADASRTTWGLYRSLGHRHPPD